MLYKKRNNMGENRVENVNNSGVYNGSPDVVKKKHGLVKCFMRHGGKMHGDFYDLF